MASSAPTAMGSPNDMKLVNKDQVDGFNAQLGAGIGAASANKDAYSGQAADILQKILGNSNNYDNLVKMMTSGPNGLSNQLQGIRDAAGSYDPQAGLNAYISRTPELQGVAQKMASGAFGSENESARALSGRMSDQALAQTASQMSQSGLLGSGAALASMSEAAINPRMQMETQLAGRQSDLYGNLLGSLSGQALSGLNAGYDAQGNRALQGALGSAQTAQSGFGLLGNTYGAQDSALAGAGSGYANLAGNEGSIYANLMGQSAQMNQPVYWSPQYAAGKDKGASAMAGMSAGATLGLNPAALTASGGWSALAVPGGAIAGWLFG